MQALIRRGAIMLALLGGVAVAAAQSGTKSGSEPKLDGAIKTAPTTGQKQSPGQALRLTAAQRKSIFTAVQKDKDKLTPPPASFRAMVGAQVPATVALHALPADAFADAPSIKPFQYTIANNEVVLIDPAQRRVVAVIKQ